MMILRTSRSSPFGRKVEIAASLVGLRDELQVAPADTSDPQDVLRRQNPLGKIWYPFSKTVPRFSTAA